MPAPTSRAALLAVLSSLVQTGDWRKHVADLRARRGYGEEYPEAADLLERRGLEWEAFIAEVRAEPARRTA